MAGGFAQRLSARDPSTEVPPRGPIPALGPRRGALYIYEPAQVAALLAAAGRPEAERDTVTGTFIAVAGASGWTDHACVFARLHAARASCPDMVLCQKGSKGAERIAAASPRTRLPSMLPAGWCGCR
jgi:hypothetical protein